MEDATSSERAFRIFRTLHRFTSCDDAARKLGRLNFVTKICIHICCDEVLEHVHAHNALCFCHACVSTQMQNKPDTWPKWMLAAKACLELSFLINDFCRSYLSRLSLASSIMKHYADPCCRKNISVHCPMAKVSPTVHLFG